MKQLLLLILPLSLINITNLNAQSPIQDGAPTSQISTISAVNDAKHFIISIPTDTTTINMVDLYNASYFYTINGDRIQINGIVRSTNEVLAQGISSTLTVPSNAATLAVMLITTSDTYFDNTNNATEQTLLNVYNGLVSQFNPPVTPTTETPINAINFIDNESINLDDGTIISNDLDAMRTDLINISNAPANWQWQNPHQSYSSPENGRYYATVFYDSNKDYIGTALHLANDIIENSSNLFPNHAYESLLSQADYMIIVGANSLSADFLDPYANVYGQTSTFAQFSDNTIDTSSYQITFSNTLGTTQFSDSIYVTAGDSLTNLVNQYSSGVYLDYLAREGYEFTGWNAPSTMPSNNTTVTPIWNQLTSYTVTFEDYDGTPLGTDTVFEGQPASAPVIPTRTGYTFTGWQPPIADIQGNITTVAQYTANTYLVTWNSDDVEVQATQLPHGSTILSHAPFVTYEGYAFQGWAIDPSTTLVTSGQIITGPLSLTAIWVETPTYTVTWRDVSFNTLKIEYVQESGLATAPTYDPGSGFVLTGWSPDSTQPIIENTIFIAQVETAPAPPSIPGDYNPISDLFGGVIGASVGAIMTLGTIDLYGIQLSAIIYLFVSMSLGLWILKAVRG